ncbi:hypothetical protein ALQ79_02175 [Pseudomonas amygdali pv. lachrymans]|nr:hypothetical protein ALQ79_02175 [Pseudomonas amygdali pv. lachrymans]
MVGVRGFELLTSCSQSRRATGLRYTPMMLKNTSEEAFSIWVTLVASLPKIQPDTN